jgi:hypothetical protein
MGGNIVPRTSKLILAAVVCLLGSLGSIAPAAAVAPFGLTLSGPSSYYPSRPLSGPFTGVLSVGGVGIPNQTIELRVDGAPAATAATTVQGTYAMSLPPIAGVADHLITAVAFGGTPLETTATLPLPVQRFTLSVLSAGTGAGTVDSTPAAISCPSTCSAQFPATTQVTLNVVAGVGSIFTGWSGDCAGNGICPLTMDADRQATAVFDLPAHFILDPPSYGFRQVTVGQTSAFTTFALTNDGGLSTGTPMVSLTGPDAINFVIGANGCNSALPPGGTCFFDVRFAPSSSGNKSATVYVASNPGGSVISMLSGTGVAPAQLTVTPMAWYPSTAYNGQAFQDFTVTNVGQQASGALIANLSGDLYAFSKITDTCTGVVLGPAQQCVVRLRYSQTNLFGGNHGANLGVTGNPGGTVNVLLNGS